ncbi:MAG TPA: glycosyltransferase family 4 protein [Candidatus Sumerlaeota bacterium]|nr:MAG: GDP-mannose-dependent alpha-(1-6)-phosphatidylinositol monomannoside mannosyltransferase [candidate division BRC1 bacterium ADurb.Bin183]HOE62464.1 glycosyltransferase family 4 protein [Candidatus Sumerlaeota bacterium]HRR31944.1 glycosyltransferase family 4 protein [Candidatus Sumerlaeia bacterium]HON50095.1 glycosyltransferase family 4 protein [Candidatus Sumerlaeota bacterium]HOR63311.1 glycosyltransferase family 4 protein [Candidatus Sumerlaeota bacterium]
MKILHTNFHKGWGGQSNRILIVCRELARKGHDVTIAIPPQSELSRRAKEAQIRIYEDALFARGFRPFQIIRDVLNLRALIKKESFDIIHTHGSQDSWAIALALSELKTRPYLVRTKHNIFPVKNHIFNRWLYGKATDKIVCISRAIVEYCASKSYLKKENLVLIHSAVNADYYGNGDGAKIRKEFNLRNRFVAGIIGRLRSEKGHLYLFKAAAKIKNLIGDFSIFVCGDGTLFRELHELAENLGIADKIIITGFRKDIPDILAALDLFILPSLSEGLGTAALEAGAAGLPIIASNVGGIPDIITDGKTGKLVSPADIDALAEAILFFYQNRDIARQYGEALREHVRNNFSEQALGDKNEELYIALTKTRQRKGL